MKSTESFVRVGGSLCLLAFCSAASAVPLLDVTSSLTVSDPTQVSRLFRSGVPSDWSTNKVYPSISGASTLSYRTYTVPAATIGSLRFVQVSVADTNVAVFVSAYDNSYTPPPSSVGYLGDAGSSGTSSGNMIAFQVRAPAGHDLVLVVNEVNPGGGIGKPFRLLVEGFVDTAYHDAFALRFVDVRQSGSNLVLNAANGFTGMPYRVYRGTNMMQSMSQWTLLQSNTLTRVGKLTVTATNELPGTGKTRFYELKTVPPP